MIQRETKICQNCKQQFVIEPEDFEFYEKIKAPLPVFCPACRLKQHLAFWPFGKFHVRKCDLSGERIVSIFPQKARFPVYKTSHWYSDKWEPPFFDYDPSQNFFDQLKKLQEKTPHPHQSGTKNTNCDYSDDVWESKNCYLCRSLFRCENLSYSYRTVRCRDSYDLTYCFDAEESYNCTYCTRVFRVRHALNVYDSFDSTFLYDCRNVSNCFMCWNLRNKAYHIMNTPYSKEEYFKKLKQYNLGSFAEIKKLGDEFKELLRKRAIHRTNLNVKTINSSGNYLSECKNCRDCYFLEEAEDCAYIFRGNQSKDCFDSNGVLKCELFYDTVQMAYGYNVRHSMFCSNCRDSEYLEICIDCSNCFGCIGLRKKEYCILNKQYSREEYEQLVAEIKEYIQKEGTAERFFPYPMAQIGYNLSLAQVYFPETKENVEEMGSYREELEKTDTKGRETASFVDDINDVDDEIVNKAFVCEETKRPFNITPEELAFYRKHNIPLPHRYPDVRTMARLRQLPVLNAIKTNCNFCKKETVSYYPPEWGYQKIACEKCYQTEVV